MLSRRSVFSAALGAAVCTVPSVAQSYTTYDVVASSPVTGDYLGNTYEADLNNDGIHDLIVDTYYANGSLQPDFAVFIANGDGTFKPPVLYAYPSVFQGGPVAMTFGDFNGDGNIDMALAIGSTNVIAVYLGKGDGTFVSPWYSAVSLPSGQVFATSAYPTIVATDFNHDGKVDLAVAGTDQDFTSTTVYVLPGEGNGLFSTADAVLTVPDSMAAGWGIDEMLTGDFDGDTNADLVVEASQGTSEGSPGATTVYVLYGDGNFSFAQTTPINTGGAPPLNTADLNSDGKSDLFSVGGTFGNDTLYTWYGQGDRTFASYTQTLPEGGYYASTKPVADFNDDGINDIIVTAENYTSSFLVFLLGTPTPGQFDIQTWNTPTPLVVPFEGFGDYALPVAGTFTEGEKPDWAYVVIASTGTSSTAYTGINGTVGQLWSDCDYPSAGRRINLCSPAIQSGSSVNFNATAHSFGNLRKMELWVDGTKLGEQYNTWEGNAFFNFNTTLSPGTHSGTYFAADFDNSILQYNFNFTVPSSCRAPFSPGVQICAPATGSSISSQSVLVQASANITGTLARMEIWVDSVKQYTETNSTSLSAAVTASPGTHQFTVFAVNTDGTVWSQAATATIQ
jgi:VCBS repeat protein/Big-like domain-containing protein/FG-GAP repeat protein